MKTRTQTRGSRPDSFLARWGRILAGCSLSLILACTSPVGPEASESEAVLDRDGDSDVEQPVIRQARDDGEWRPGGTGGPEDEWRRW